MSNCSGRASFNSSNFDVTPMRQPASKTRDFVLSAEAPEFVPQFHKPPVIANEMAGNIGPPLIGIPLHQQQLQHSQMPHPSFNQHNHHQQINHAMINHDQMRHQQQLHHQNHHQPHYQQNHNHHGHQHQNKNNGHFSVNNRLHQFNGVGGNNHRQSGHHQQQQHMGRGGPKNNHHKMQPADQFNNAESGEVSEAENHALEFLNEVIHKLMNDPGLYETYQKELMTLYLEFVDNHHVISNAIESIFVSSIDEQNFRYTGARLCRLLDSINPSPDSKFRHLLNCKLEYNDQEIVQFMNNETHKVRNTTLFLAELYIQLQNDGSRITSIATSIHNAISLLMPKMSPENIKCVCQTLKLCGYELDIDRPKETEDLINQLNNCENIDVSTQRLLTSVIELRKNRWGRSTEPTDATLSQPLLVEANSGTEFSNDPVFYGPDGNVLTEEERAFLWNVTSYPTDGYDDEEENDPDALVEIEPEMDLEIQLAFKDFVTNQNKK